MDAHDGSDIEASSFSSSNDIAVSTRKLGKSVTLDILMRDGIMHPEEKSLTIKYMGRRYFGDLLSGGQIRACDTGETFASPSAWAIYCKKQVNPGTKVSGCGWGAIKYKGQALNLYKAMWLNKQLSPSGGSPRLQSLGSTDMPEAGNTRTGPNESNSNIKVPLTIESIPLESYNELLDSPVACFQENPATNRIAPPSVPVYLSCRALLVMTAHCHGQSYEVSGYLAGQDVWEENDRRVVCIHKAYPFGGTVQKEDELRSKVRDSGLRLCGWYHSHPERYAHPTLYDVECQLRFQRSLAKDRASSSGHDGHGAEEDIAQQSVCCVISPYLTARGSESLSSSEKEDAFGLRFQCFHVSEEVKPPSLKPLRVSAADICGYPCSVSQLDVDFRLSLSLRSSTQKLLASLLKGSDNGPSQTLKYMRHFAKSCGQQLSDEVLKLFTDLCETQCQGHEQRRDTS